jgi:DNA invertase Pin-like site-specific DNA recombinase
VTRLDRLARSTFDLLNILKATAAKDASFLSLAEPWANTSSAIGKLMLTVLSGVAEFELNLIALRTNEGTTRARQSGVKFGPKFKLSSHQIQEIRKRKEAGESCRFLARSYGVSPNTISISKPSRLFPVVPGYSQYPTPQI